MMTRFQRYTVAPIFFKMHKQTEYKLTRQILCTASSAICQSLNKLFMLL